MRTNGDAPSAKPLILLLQGPVGPFFRILGAALEAADYDVLKINFNGGDWLFSRAAGGLNFCGTTEEWADWLISLFGSRKPATIALFGDSRPYHRQAVALAECHGIPVLCFEEGYVRPDFITCEWSGNNALSPLRKLKLDAATPAAAEPVEAVKGNLFQAMASFALCYYASKAMGSVVFRGNAHHRNRALASEALLWTRNLYRKLRYYPANNALMLDLIENRENAYFVVALQVHDDQQLLRHGRGWTMERLITESIRSFQRFADLRHHLVVKVHPMDRGHRSYRAFVREVARIARCPERIHIVDDGSIGLLIRHSLGLVTVNSTSGLLALNHGKPLLALGNAIYDSPDLMPQARHRGSTDLDRFWSAPTTASRERVEAFKAGMRKASLVNGSFYIRAQIEETGGRVVRRLQAELRSAAPASSDRLEAPSSAPERLTFRLPKTASLAP